LLAFGSGKAFSQCNYVTTENGKETKLSIPCDFPVLVSTNPDGTVDLPKFNKLVSSWKLKNSLTNDLTFYPTSNTKDFIQIPVADYNKFSEKRKIEISSLSFYYKILKQ
jgi:hypothetical protein